MKFLIPVLFGILGPLIYHYYELKGFIILIIGLSAIQLFFIGFRKFYNRKHALLINSLPNNEKELYLNELDGDQKKEVMKYMQKLSGSDNINNK